MFNPIAALITRHQRRRSGGDTALRQRPVFGPVRLITESCRIPPLPLGCHRRQAAVGWVCDKRGSIIPVSVRHPKRIVSADSARTAPACRFAALDTVIDRAEHPVEERRVSLTVEQFAPLFLHCRNFVVGKEFAPGKRGGPFERGGYVVDPGAAKVRVSVGGSRRRPRLATFGCSLGRAVRNLSPRQ
jgi:hypothetical protein